MENTLEASIHEFANYVGSKAAFTEARIRVMAQRDDKWRPQLEKLVGRPLAESLAQYHAKHGRTTIQWKREESYRVFQGNAILPSLIDLESLQKSPQTQLRPPLKALLEQGYLVLDDLDDSGGNILMAKTGIHSPLFLYLSPNGKSYPLDIASYEAYIAGTLSHLGLCGWQLLYSPETEAFAGKFLGEDLAFIEGFDFSFSYPAFRQRRALPASTVRYSDINRERGLPNRFLELFNVQNDRFQFIKAEVYKGLNPLLLLPLAELCNWNLPPALIGFYMQVHSASIISKRDGEIWSSFRIPGLLQANKGTNAFFGFQNDPVAALEGTYPFLIDEAGYILMRPSPTGLRFELAIDFDNVRPLKCDFDSLIEALLDSEGRSGWQRELR